MCIEYVIKLLFFNYIMYVVGAQKMQVVFWKSKYYQWFILAPLRKAVPKAVPISVYNSRDKSNTIKL